MKAKLTAVVAVLAVAALAAPAAAQNTDANASADVELSFGQQISIMVSSQQAEVEHTVENAAFDIAFADNRSRAVRERARELAGEMKDKKRSLDRLEQNYTDGELTESEYAAKKMKVQASAEALNHSANHVLNRTEGLSRAEQNGVNVTAIRLLASNASEMTGQEVAEIARGIAGGAPHVDAGSTPDARPGTPGNAGQHARSDDNRDAHEGNETGEATDGGMAPNRTHGGNASPAADGVGGRGR